MNWTDFFEIETFVVTPFAQNARLIWEKGREKARLEAVCVDPGGESEKLLAFLKQKNLTLSAIWLTHSHLDHCGGVKKLKTATGAKLYAHPLERDFRSHVVQIAAMYGCPGGEFDDCPEPDTAINGNEVLKPNRESFKALFTPGHSPGHLCFYHAASGVLLAGDALFAGSIGRTDLPGGDYETLIQSIREQILTLPDNTLVLSGHGPDTTVGAERRSNPFLQGA